MMTATPVLNSCATVLPVPQAAPVGAPAQKEGLFLSILGKAVQENLPGQVQDPALSPLQAKDPLARPEEDDTAAPLSEEANIFPLRISPFPAWRLPIRPSNGRRQTARKRPIAASRSGPAKGRPNQWAQSKRPLHPCRRARFRPKTSRHPKTRPVCKEG